MFESKTTKFISAKNISSRSPLWPSLCVYLVLDRIDAAQWVWDAIGCIFLIWWIGSIISMVKQESIDIFAKKMIDGVKTIIGLGTK